MLGKLRAVLRALKPHVPAIVIALVALVIAWLFVVTTLRHTRPMGLPLDDSYIYMTYAKQFGRGQPFSYYPGGGYSAGSTSVLWPMVLAPFWALGARGHALVWVSFGLCTALYAAVAVGCYRLARRLVMPGGELAGIVAAALVLSIAPFAFTSLSGMEVAFASALLIATLLLLVETPSTGKPTKRLIACLAATSLSRPEATLIVGAIVAISVLNRLRQRDLRAAAWWMTPLVAPLAWVVANKLLAGQFFPNTGVAKSHFYLPGFDWTYWWSTITTLSGKLLKGLFWDAASPLVWPRVIALLWLVGIVRIMLWARRERRWLVGLTIITAPLLLMFAVIASSGLWNVQNYRYITPAFPLLMIPVGCALAPMAAVVTRRPRAMLAWAVGAAAFVGGFAWSTVPNMRADMKLFAQGAMDTNTQVVAIGEYLATRHPGARVMFHDAGAIAYYGDGEVYDMLGLVTNYQAGVANHGPGSRFEFLESLPPERRPTHFAYYPAWLGTAEFFGARLLHTPLRPGFEKRRLVGDGDMQVIAATWDHVGTGERPLGDHAGWTMIDRIDIANLVSERAHGWRGELGRRKFGDPTAKWSFVGRELGEHGLIVDGGRTIRGGGERFTIEPGDPTRPSRLVIRTGGERAYPYQEALTRPVALTLQDASGRVIGTATLPAPTGALVEIAFDLPPGTSAVRVVATAPYRVFHWFVLQPDR